MFYYNNRYMFGTIIIREPTIFCNVIASRLKINPYTYAITIPMYDNGAYTAVSKFEMAKNLNKYPNNPMTTLIIRDNDNTLFNCISLILSNRVTDKTIPPKKYEMKI